MYTYMFNKLTVYFSEFVYGRNKVRVRSSSSCQFQALPKPLQRNETCDDVTAMQVKMDEHVTRQREDDDVKWREGE